MYARRMRYLRAVLKRRMANSALARAIRRMKKAYIYVYKFYRRNARIIAILAR